MGTVCAACGRLSVPDGLETMTEELRRQHNQIRYILLAMGLVLLLAMALVGAWMLSGGRKGSDRPPDSAPKPQAIAPAAGASSSTVQASGAAPDAPHEQPVQQPSTGATPKESNQTGSSPSGKIDPQSVEDALHSMMQRRGSKGNAPQSSAASNAPVAADRYPGSEAVDMKDTSLPDIGIPVGNQVYTTSDSLSTVMAYYQRLYPDAQVMEISGQNIIAVDKPGMTKVIAIATTGSETRIAIVQPGN